MNGSRLPSSLMNRMKPLKLFLLQDSVMRSLGRLCSMISKSIQKTISHAMIIRNLPFCLTRRTRKHLCSTVSWRRLRTILSHMSIIASQVSRERFHSMTYLSLMLFRISLKKSNVFSCLTLRQMAMVNCGAPLRCMICRTIALTASTDGIL